MDSSGVNSAPGEIQLLVTNLNEVKIGFDTEFVNEIVEPEEVRSERVEVFSLYRKMNFLDRETPFNSPKVILYNPSCDRTVGVVVEAPEDLLTIQTELISFIPPLIQGYLTPPAIWGALKREEDIVLLIDLSKIKL